MDAYVLSYINNLCFTTKVYQLINNITFYKKIKLLDTISDYYESKL